jgi:integral membrane protein
MALGLADATGKDGTKVGAALIRYRVLAYVVGVALILLVVVGMPLKYVWHNPVVVDTVGLAHGFLYMVLLLAIFDLGRRAKWPLKRMVLVMLAGTVPFVSFYAERVVTRWTREPQHREREPEPVAAD